MRVTTDNDGSDVQVPRLVLNGVDRLRRGFAARFADLSRARALRQDVAPTSGDLVKVRVDRIGHHQKLETPDGRRSELHVGDEIVLAYADRYATDQFHAVVPDSLEPCHLIAAGGLAGNVLHRHVSSRQPTSVTPLGLLCDKRGQVLNLSRFKRPAPNPVAINRPPMIMVVGTSMNAGKTTTAAAIIRAARAQRMDVCAVKATGTGAGGDMWKYTDAGADRVLDFADAGFASTYRLAEEALFPAVDHLLTLTEGTDLIVCELADGVLQQETRALLERHGRLRQAEGIVLAAGDALSARAGVRELTALGLPPSCVSGALTGSPLVIEEARAVVPCPVLSISEIVEDERSLARMISRIASPALDVVA